MVPTTRNAMSILNLAKLSVMWLVAYVNNVHVDSYLHGSRFPFLDLVLLVQSCWSI